MKTLKKWYSSLIIDPVSFLRDCRSAFMPTCRAKARPTYIQDVSCWSNILLVAGACLLLAGCSTTVATLNPSPQKPVCERKSSALVLWETQWRQNQKDIAEREFAAETGLRQFLVQSGCFAHAELRRMNTHDLELLKGSDDKFDKVISITVREIGPIVMLFSTDGMIEGGTEVVFDITEYALPELNPKRQFTVNWFNGGAFVIKGVESLPNDMQEALRIGMKPGGAQ